MSDNGKSVKVLLLNDDQTTMEFVVQVLESIFGKTRDEALKLVLAIHRDGSGECGVYAAEYAAKIAERVAELARRNGHPLRCITEPNSRALISGLVHRAQIGEKSALGYSRRFDDVPRYFRLTP